MNEYPYFTSCCALRSDAAIGRHFFEYAIAKDVIISQNYNSIE